MIEKTDNNYRIVLEGWFWTGKEWVEDANKAFLFVNEEAATDELARLDPEKNLPLKERGYMLPLKIWLISRWPIPSIKVQRELLERIRLDVNLTDYDCVKECFIEWEQFTALPEQRVLFLENRIDFGVKGKNENEFHLQFKLWQNIQNMFPFLLTNNNFTAAEAGAIAIMLGVMQSANALPPNGIISQLIQFMKGGAFITVHTKTN